MGDEQAVADALGDFLGQGGEGRRTAHHVVADAGETLDQRRDRDFGIDQRLPLVLDDTAHHLDDANLDHPVGDRVRPGGFEVDEGDRGVEQQGRMLGPADTPPASD